MKKIRERRLVQLEEREEGQRRGREEGRRRELVVGGGVGEVNSWDAD